MSQNLRNLLNQAFAAGARAGCCHTAVEKRRVIDDLVARGEGLPFAWEPEFDAMAPEQEALAVTFSVNVSAGGSCDPVTILEVAERLYQAERNFVAEKTRTVPA